MTLANKERPLHPEPIQDVLDLIYDREQPGSQAQLVAWMKTVIERVEGPIDAEIDPAALATEVRPHLAALRRRLSAQERGFEPEGDPPIFWMDAELVNQVFAIGRAGADTASAMRGRCEESWEEALAEDDLDRAMGLWTGEAPAFIYYLIWAVLHDVLLPRNDAFARRGGSGMSTVVLSALHAGLWKKDRMLVPEGHAHTVRSGGATVGLVRALPADMCSREWLRITRSVTAHRLLRWLVASAFYQYVAGETRSGDAPVLKVRRGFEGLANVLGLAPSGKTRSELREALDAMAAVAFDIPTMEGRGLCSWSRNKRSGELRITVAPALSPDFIFGIGKSPGQRAGRRLVPVTMRFPPLVGRERDHAAQLVLQQLVLRELRDRATDLADRGGVTITDERWRDLAVEADLPLTILDAVRRAWADGDVESPPFVATSVAGGTTLAGDYETELGMLLEAGELERRGRENALRSHRAKRGRRAGSR